MRGGCQRKVCANAPTPTHHTPPTRVPVRNAARSFRSSGPPTWMVSMSIKLSWRSLGKG
jgi:hypothetical protein